MHLSKDMTFQYFFFDTYIGYFLQVLPLALISGMIFSVVRYRRKGSPFLFYGLFMCYLTGLVGLVLLLDVIRPFWYWLLYGVNTLSFERFFSFDYVWKPDFWNHFGSETLGNILLFLPFGILYPLSSPEIPFKRVIACGVFCSLCLELLQPILGRAFDINDLLMNTTGLLLSATLYFDLKRIR